MRAAWRLYRSRARRLLLVAAVPELLRGLLALPSLLIGAIVVRATARLFSDLSRLRTDPQGLQAEVQAAMRPSPELAMVAGLCAGISIAVVVIGWSAITAAALAASEGRPISISATFRTVAARRTSIVIPALALGIVWAWIGVASGLLQASGTGGVTRSQSALAGLFGAGILLVTVAAFILAVRWSLAVPAILAEDLGLRAGIARGANLTHGVRVRLGLAFIAVAILQGLTVGIPAALAGVVGLVGTKTVDAGVGAYLVIGLVGGFLWAPFIPALLAVAYRDRIATEGPVTRPEPDGPTAPADQPETADSEAQPAAPGLAEG